VYWNLTDLFTLPIQVSRLETWVCSVTGILSVKHIEMMFFYTSKAPQICSNCLKMHCVLGGCTEEHKSQFEMYLTGSLQGNETQAHFEWYLANFVWFEKQIHTKANIIIKNTGQMLTWRVFGVVNLFLQFKFMNKLGILVDFNSWCELGTVAILDFFYLFFKNSQTPNSFTNTFMAYT